MKGSGMSYHLPPMTLNMKIKKIKLLEEWRKDWSTPKITVAATGKVLQEPILGEAPIVFWQDELNKKEKGK